MCALGWVVKGRVFGRVRRGYGVGAAGGAGTASWTNTNEGKVISAAFLDSVNKMIPHVRELVAKSMPDRVATKKQ